MINIDTIAIKKAAEKLKKNPTLKYYETMLQVKKESNKKETINKK